MTSQENSAPPKTERRQRPRRLVIFKIVTLAIGIGAGLILAEVGLRVTERIRLGDRVPVVVSDPVLEIRNAPNTAGHDAKGFRNVSVPAEADVVALGDSQTWGVNVHTPDAWPQQLAKLSGHSVYNMAVGGYGPVQYWRLADNALELSPKVVVVGLYLGNDIYDAYAQTYPRDNNAELRTNQVSDELRKDTIHAKSQFYWDEEKNFHYNYGRDSPAGWSFWVREHSAIGRLLNRKGWWPGSADVDYEIDKAWAQTYPDHGIVCDDDNIRTVLTTAYRLTGLDLEDPRLVEGVRITKTVLSRIQQKVVTHNARLLVLMIPTKELVYAGLMQRKGKLTGTYARLVENETRVRNDLRLWFAENGIKYVDALPDLQAAIAAHQQVYPSSSESHPNASGYAVLAATVNLALKNDTR